MARLIVDGSGVVKGGTDADYSDGALKSAGPVSAERMITAVAMVMRDEINLVRAVGVLGLGSRSVDDIVNAIKAKL